MKLYSYWFNNWGRLLSLLHLISFKKLEFVTRVHGYDYDPTRKKDGFIPFRNFEMHQVSQIFSISNYGVRLLKREYSFFKETHLSRLGVSDQGNNPIMASDVFHIVSCSSLIKLKRVDLIVDILMHMTFPS
ncbi:MAG: hypothetical protein IPL10_13675 [Bacteroidetes bacterium]|nr:hypothetical protein [Bacteroidota bacterium]